MLAFAAYGLVYPIVMLVSNPEDARFEDGENLLAAVLSYAYITCLLGMTLLSPSVFKFQILRADLVNIKDFPTLFYKHFTVTIELKKRYEQARLRYDILRDLGDQVGGHAVALMIAGYAKI